jgi:hypothetical protein
MGQGIGVRIRSSKGLRPLSDPECPSYYSASGGVVLRRGKGSHSSRFRYWSGSGLLWCTRNMASSQGQIQKFCWPELRSSPFLLSVSVGHGWPWKVNPQLYIYIPLNESFKQNTYYLTHRARVKMTICNQETQAFCLTVPKMPFQPSARQ